MITARLDQMIDAVVMRNLRMDYRPRPPISLPEEYTIVLNGEDIFAAPQYDPAILPSFEESLTEYDCEYYERVGWKNFSSDNHSVTLHPLLAPKPMFYNSHESLVVPFNNQTWVIDIDVDYNRDRIPVVNSLTMIRTDSRSLTPQRGGWPRAYCTLFGQPHWKQGAFYRLGPDGTPLRSFAVIENGWGDAGNVNVFVSLGPDGIPDRLYYEASCC